MMLKFIPERDSFDFCTMATMRAHHYFDAMELDEGELAMAQEAHSQQRRGTEQVLQALAQRAGNRHVMRGAPRAPPYRQWHGAQQQPCETVRMLDTPEDELRAGNRYVMRGAPRAPPYRQWHGAHQQPCEMVRMLDTQEDELRAGNRYAMRGALRAPPYRQWHGAHQQSCEMVRMLDIPDDFAPLPSPHPLSGPAWACTAPGQLPKQEQGQRLQRPSAESNPCQWAWLFRLRSILPSRWTWVCVIVLYFLMAVVYWQIRGAQRSAEDTSRGQQLLTLEQIIQQVTAQPPPSPPPPPSMPPPPTHPPHQSPATPLCFQKDGAAVMLPTGVPQHKGCDSDCSRQRWPFYCSQCRCQACLACPRQESRRTSLPPPWFNYNTVESGVADVAGLPTVAAVAPPVVQPQPPHVKMISFVDTVVTGLSAVAAVAPQMVQPQPHVVELNSLTDLIRPRLPPSLPPSLLPSLPPPLVRPAVAWLAQSGEANRLREDEREDERDAEDEDEDEDEDTDEDEDEDEDEGGDDDADAGVRASMALPSSAAAPLYPVYIKSSMQAKKNTTACSPWWLCVWPQPPSPAPPQPLPPPPPPPVPSPPPSPSLPPEDVLNSAKCNALISDPGSRLNQLWGKQGWALRDSNKGAACWGGNGRQFFDDAWWGRSCASRNWYSGNDGKLGEPGGGPSQKWVNPHFTAPQAPALLGFDHTIDWHCHGKSNHHAKDCVKANMNILSLFGNALPYNMCRNGLPTTGAIGSTRSMCCTTV